MAYRYPDSFMRCKSCKSGLFVDVEGRYHSLAMSLKLSGIVIMFVVAIYYRNMLGIGIYVVAMAGVWYLQWWQNKHQLFDIKSIQQYEGSAAMAVWSAPFLWIIRGLIVIGALVVAMVVLRT